jgi:thiamine transport system substrate-binding protein
MTNRTRLDFQTAPQASSPRSWVASTAVLFSIILAAVSPASAADKPVVTIHTYESFTAEWGPGPEIEKSFESRCACDLKWVSVADGVALLNRLKIEGAASDADILLGLDTNLVAEAEATGLFAPHGVDVGLVTALPDGWADRMFLPFDHGWFAIIHDSAALKEPPASLKELVEGDPAQKIIIQDPRTSTPGLGLLLWMRKVYGDAAPEAWARLSKRVLTVTPGWSEAYGLFTSGEAPMVLSYTTSPAYHVIAEGSDRYKAAAFSEGHYAQIEVAGLTVKGGDNPLARDFMAFMLTPGFQDHIPEKNWMLPVAATSQPLNPAFDGLVKPTQSLLFTPQEVSANRDAWIAEWLAAFGR